MDSIHIDTANIGSLSAGKLSKETALPVKSAVLPISFIYIT
jgi:hypothetical protein